ncbi:hypothetical protein [Massilia sp. DWR3-1-1]|uniref:hypothetical protein n=1 Tax=Massilia sp. DWR3-1-1 TaxID=2804559 RepID=UPI003CE90EE9
MNKLYWVGIIVWGLFVTGCGLTSAGAGEVQQPQDVVFLLAGGLLTSLVGLVGLCGFMGWMGRSQAAQKSYL